MGWLGLVGSLKVQVSLAEYRLFYRALLQKRPVKKIDILHCLCMLTAGNNKVYVLSSLAEYSLFYRALLQKRRIFLGSLIIVALAEARRRDMQ